MQVEDEVIPCFTLFFLLRLTKLEGQLIDVLSIKNTIDLRTEEGDVVSAVSG